MMRSHWPRVWSLGEASQNEGCSGSCTADTQSDGRNRRPIHRRISRLLRLTIVGRLKRTTVSMKPQCANRRSGPNSLERRQCSNSALLVKTATSLCLLPSLRPGYAPMNARFARRASTTSWAMFARTAAGDSFRDRSGHRGIGKATTILAKMRRAPRSSTDPLIVPLMQSFQLRSRTFRRISARTSSAN